MMPASIYDFAISFYQSSRAILLMLLIGSIENSTVLLVHKQSVSMEQIVPEMAFIIIPIGEVELSKTLHFILVPIAIISVVFAGKHKYAMAIFQPINKMAFIVIGLSIKNIAANTMFAAVLPLPLIVNTSRFLMIFSAQPVPKAASPVTSIDHTAFFIVFSTIAFTRILCKLAFINEEAFIDVFLAVTGTLIIIELPAVRKAAIVVTQGQSIQFIIFPLTLGLFKKGFGLDLLSILYDAYY